MNLLNDVAARYPDAISFAPGKPADDVIDADGAMAALDVYVDHRANTLGLSRDEVRAGCFQYQRTAGIITDLVARQLANDEGILVDPDSLLMTCGAQEAIAVLLLGLFDPASDVLLCTNPTYIGVVSAAISLGIPIVGVPAGSEGLDVAALRRVVGEVRAGGRVPRALYDVPDFNNPLGTTMPRHARHALLDVAVAEGMLVFEDNAYGMLAYDDRREPTLKALDEAGVVVLVGSFAKTLFPGLRLGYLVADQPCAPDGRTLAAELCRVKSMLSITSSVIGQAIAGGLLLGHGCSLRPYVATRLRRYARRRDRMLDCLERQFRDLGGQVSWNRPRGGFFLTVTLPFPFDAGCLDACASDFGVVVCPMSFVSIGPGRENQVRLSFSAVEGAEIDQGIGRFAEYVASRLGRSPKA